MTISYQLHNNVEGELACIIKTSTEDDWQYSIPISEGNTDYQEYLAWLAEGNEPLPADSE